MKNRNLDHKDHWKTPSDFYLPLNEIYNFDFDPCPFMHDISVWNGLKIEWGERNFVNPPYSDLKASGFLKTSFIYKAIEESRKGKLCVCLLPVSLGTKLFHDHIAKDASKIHILKGRINFEGINAKGQIVNIPNPTYETFLFEGKLIPLHIQKSGQHESMLIEFDGRKEFSLSAKYQFFTISLTA